MRARVILSVSTILSITLISGCKNTVGGDISEVAAKAAGIFADWENCHVYQCDEKPSVRIGQMGGYRVVLRMSRKEYTGIHQQQKPTNTEADMEFVLKYSHMEIVLFPGQSQLPNTTRDLILWQQLEHEHFVKPVAVGNGYGFQWFVNGTLYHQDVLRNKLGLQGGDDPLTILVDGLFVEDKGSWTRNTLELVVAKHEDEAIEYIEKAVKGHMEDNPGPAVRPLAFIRTDRATELLKRYYGIEETKVAVAYALTYKPYRQGAKQQYLDMLRDRKYWDSAIAACTQFGWKESLSILEDMCRRPDLWNMYRDAFIAKRQLGGEPLSQDIVDARDTLRKSVWPRDRTSEKDFKDAKKALVNTADKEAATVIAVDLTLFNTKASGSKIARVNQTGRDILRQMPLQYVEMAYGIVMKFSEPHFPRRVRDLQQFLKELINGTAQ
jgi:hypothetical protein